jgi:hypothetical protein
MVISSPTCGAPAKRFQPRAAKGSRSTRQPRRHRHRLRHHLHRRSPTRLPRRNNAPQFEGIFLPFNVPKWCDLVPVSRAPRDTSTLISTFANLYLTDPLNADPSTISRR